VAALATDRERVQWARVQRVTAALGGAADTPDNAELHERLALVKGVLQLRLEDAWNARLWQVQRDLKDLDLALREAQSRWIRVQRALRSMPANTGEFAIRVASLKARIDAIQSRLAATQRKQSAYLAQIAANELQAQKGRVAAYQVQARFALASIYDRAANAQSSADRTKSAAPIQKGVEAEPPTSPPPAPAPEPQR
jgi:chromosome segregation ATPase